MKHSDTSITDSNVQFYLSLVEYCCEVIFAFIAEVEDAGVKANQSKWRSACLDYHIALTLADSAFTKERQEIVQKDMNRTWADFRQKKAYKRIQSSELSMIVWLVYGH
jgi:hypothetical protein